MQQRVALARGLAIEPSVLLLDEPFGALDALTRSYMQEELLGIVRGSGTTALLVTHDIDEALLLADRVLVMSSRPGRIKHELRVPFGPERSIDSLLQNPEYGRIRSELRHLLRPEVAEELHG
jgi:NitT/TauT family transport system ATP-binding protein